MNQIEEQKALIEFLEAALQEAGDNSNTSPEKLGMIQRELEEARLNLSKLNQAVDTVEAKAVIDVPVPTTVSLPEIGHQRTIQPESGHPIDHSMPILIPDLNLQLQLESRLKVFLNNFK